MCYVSSEGDGNCECAACKRSFATRHHLQQHLGSAVHLNRLAELRKQKKKKPEMEVERGIPNNQPYYNDLLQRSDAEMSPSRRHKRQKTLNHHISPDIFDEDMAPLRSSPPPMHHLALREDSLSALTRLLGTIGLRKDVCCMEAKRNACLNRVSALEVDLDGVNAKLETKRALDERIRAESNALKLEEATLHQRLDAIRGRCDVLGKTQTDTTAQLDALRRQHDELSATLDYTSARLLVDVNAGVIDLQNDVETLDKDQQTVYRALCDRGPSSQTLGQLQSALIDRLLYAEPMGYCMTRKEHNTEMLPFHPQPCPMCKNTFELGQIIIETPCHHVYHDACFKRAVWDIKENAFMDIEKYSMVCHVCEANNITFETAQTVYILKRQ